MIKAVIFDWAGTTIDYGCFAPVDVFLKIFENRGVQVTMDQARQPMGMLKRDHIKEMTKMSSIKNQWMEKYGRFPSEEDIDILYGEFVPTLMENLKDYTTPIPEVLRTVNTLRNKNIKIGSTTGYTREMMDVVMPEAKAKGYLPDHCVTSDEMPAGRPAPYMIYQNAIALNVWPLKAIVKVGDTVSDIKEGVNAGVWSVGVIRGSSELGLTEKEVMALNEKDRQGCFSNVKEKFLKAGADFVIEDMSELPDLIEDINHRVSSKG